MNRLNILLCIILFLAFSLQKYQFQHNSKGSSSSQASSTQSQFSIQLKKNKKSLGKRHWKEGSRHKSRNYQSDLSYLVFKYLFGVPDTQFSIPKLKSMKYSLENWYNALYLMELYMGTSSQRIELALDTGSDWLVVASAECDCTDAPMYDQTTSDAYVQVSDKLQAQYYGDGEIYGYYVEDNVYLDKQQTKGVEGFQFLLANFANNLYTESGVFGFSRDYSIWGYDAGPLYYHYLQEQGQISSRLFSLYLGPEKEESFIEFDTSDVYQWGKPDVIVAMQMEDHFFWLQQVQGIRMGTLSISAARVEEQPIIYDSGTSLLYYPPSYKNSILFPITAFADSVYEDGYWYVDCVADLPSLFLYIDQYWIEVPSEAYLFKQFTDTTGKMCLIGLVENDDEYWLAGDVFLISYYQIYDDQNGLMTLTPRHSSNINEIIFDEYGPIRWFSDFDQPEVWLPVTITTGMVVLTGAIIGILYGAGVLQAGRKSFIIQQ